MSGARCPQSQLFSGDNGLVRTYCLYQGVVELGDAADPLRYLPACTVQVFALEESSLAGRIASVLRQSAPQLIVCDHRHHTLIGHGYKGNLTDSVDACQLFQLGAIVEVFTQTKRAKRISRLQSNRITFPKESHKTEI